METSNNVPSDEVYDGQFSFDAGVSGVSGSVSKESSHNKLMRKRLIGCACGFVVLLIISIVIIIISKGLANNNAEKDQKVDFNRFINYVLNGTDDNEQYTKDYDVYSDYFFEENVNSEDVLNKTNELFLAFDSRINKDDKNNSDKMLIFVTDIRETLEFMLKVYTKPEMFYHDLLREYLDKGERATIELVNNYYDFSNVQSNSIIEDYYGYFTQWASEALDLIKIYNKAGCIEAYNFDEFCMKNSVSAEVLADVAQRKKSLKSFEDGFVYYRKLAKDIVSDVFKINELLYYDSNSEENP